MILHSIILRDLGLCIYHINIYQLLMKNLASVPAFKMELERQRLITKALAKDEL